MTQITQLEAQLATLSQQPGLLGCALVDSSTGLSWLQTGCVVGDSLIAEAACEYWRLYLRHRDYFADMGDIRAQVIIHSAKRITIMGCGLEMILIAITDERTAVDWASWQAQVRQIKHMVERL